MKNMFQLVLLIAFLAMSFSAMAQQTSEEKAGEAKGIEERVKALEDAIGPQAESDNWFDRIQIGGLIEVEAFAENTDFDDPTTDDEDTTDVDLATVELAIDARIVDHVDGHILVKYEDDDVFIDEGFITLTGSDDFPAYLVAGKQYIPFGNYDSHFITDPVTLTLGETVEGAVIFGYLFGNEMVDISAGFFNGAAKEAGDDDIIENYVVSGTYTPFEGLNFGLSYMSNLAGSDGLQEDNNVVDSDNLDSLVAGWSAFVSYEFLERFKVIGEYLSALDEFEAGELYDAGETKEREPSAWNVELGVSVVENVEIAVRYSGSDDGGNEFLPETEYGGVINWAFFENTNLALEYLHWEFEDDFKETDLFTMQLAVEF